MDAARASALIAVATLALVWLGVVSGDSAAPLERYHLPKELALLVGTAASTLILALQRRAPSSLDALDGAALVVVASGLLSSVGAVDGDVALRLACLSGAGAALFLAVRAPAVPRVIVVSGVALVALAASAVVLGEALGLWPTLAPERLGPGGTLGQRNNAAHALALVAPLLAHELLRSQHARRALLGAALAAVVGAVLVTRSRAGWLALSVGGIGTLALQVRSRGLRATLPALVAVALGLSVLLVSPALRWRSAHPYRDTARALVDPSDRSAQGRRVQASTSLRLWSAHPLLGVGPGHWAVHYPAVAEADDPTVARETFRPTGRLMTSDLMALAVERGAVGLVALVALVALWWRRRDPTELWALPTAGALLVLSALDCVLQIAMGACAAALLAALAAPRSAAALARSWRARGALLGLLALLGLGAWRAADRLLGQQAMGRARSPEELAAVARAHPAMLAPRVVLAERSLGTQDCAAALPWLEEIAARRPHWPHAVGQRNACRARALGAQPDNAASGDGPPGAE